MISQRVASLLMVAALSSISVPAMAEEFDLGSRPLTLMADPASPPAETGQASERDTAAVKTPPAPAAVESPNIHGFAAVAFKTAYVTPRGLVVENQGLVVQPVVGLVLPVGDIGVFKKAAIVSGVWNSINSNQGDTNVGPWNEMDFFLAFNATVADKFNTALTYGAWNFPQSTVNKPSTEHNLDLKISYDDSGLWGKSGFSINPYVDLWWAISGSSTVVLGSQGDTGYVEIGMAPTFTVTPTKDYPIKLTFPTYFSVGPEDYWGDEESGGTPDGNFGVFSTSINASMPLACIPSKYGFWHVDAGVSYFYLINDNLLDAGQILSGNSERNVFVASLGFGFNF
jgi:hypothetical protein